jgi:hypothetical protein
MRMILPAAVAGFAVVAALSSALAAPGATNGPVATSPIAQTPLGNPDAPPPQPTKPTVGTSDTTPGTTAPPPGTDTSTAAPGGQAESTKNGALGTDTGGTDTGANVSHRHHGPKRPTTMHDRSDASGPPADATPK